MTKAVDFVKSALGSDPVANVPTWVAVGIPADLLSHRPDIRSVKRQVAAQSAQIGVAEADLYPTIFINGTLGYEAQDLSKLFESQSFFGSITPNFKWTILNYGRIVNNVRIQQAKTQDLIAAYQNHLLTAAQQVQAALRGFLRSREQAEDQAAASRLRWRPPSSVQNNTRQASSPSTRSSTWKPRRCNSKIIWW